ncbi:MAG: hypothetical protein M3O91_02605 [Chloroflexota bacterium]|nr:hypothetical protein [Chloroflexota bacterium]
MVFALTLAAAILAKPVAVLAVSAGGDEWLGRLDDGERFGYSFLHSIYQAQVEEELQREDGRMRTLRGSSPDIRAVEYFGWDARIVGSGGLYVQEAPAVDVPLLLIRVTAEGRQRLAAARWTLEMRARFGDALLALRPTHRPLASLVIAR